MVSTYEPAKKALQSVSNVILNLQTALPIHLLPLFLLLLAHDRQISGWKMQVLHFGLHCLTFKLKSSNSSIS